MSNKAVQQQNKMIKELFKQKKDGTRQKWETHKLKNTRNDNCMRKYKDCFSCHLNLFKR